MLKNTSQNLTSKQKKVYDFIVSYIEKRNCSPTISELADFLQVSSLRTVTQYLEILEKKKKIVRSKGSNRGIKLIEINELSTVMLPVLSAAGCDNMNVFAEQHYDEFITLDKDFLKGNDPQKVVAFRAMGDSMNDAGIETGDLVLTKITTDVKQRDKVVAVVDGMALIKQISFTPNAVVLSPMSHDPQFRPIIMKRDFQVFGKVIEIIKSSFNTEELIYEAI